MDQYLYTGTCTRVIDGDTYEMELTKTFDFGFKIQTTQTFTIRIRLARLDTPEIYRPSSQAELDHGRAAKQFVEDEILFKTVFVETFKDRPGKYGGRYLGEVTYDGKNLAEELLKAGFQKKDHYPED